jgi:hypothetical protein
LAGLVDDAFADISLHSQEPEAYNNLYAKISREMGYCMMTVPGD